MAEKAQVAKLLSAFVADEDVALATGEQGSFWPDNHHRITPAATQAGCLAPEDRTRFYSHYMRISDRIPAVSASEYPYLVAGYRELLPLLGPGKRLEPLFCFGFDEEGPLSPEPVTAAMFQGRVKALAQCDRYASLPAQWARIDKSRAFVGDAETILLTLRRLRYRDAYPTNVVLWGMVLIALLDKRVRTRLVGEMLDGGFDFPEAPDQLSTLNAVVQAVTSEFGSDEVALHGLAARLRAAEAARLAVLAAKPRVITESILFAQALELPFMDDDDWAIEIRLPVVGATRHVLLSPDCLTLEIWAKPNLEWSLNVFTEHRGRFSEWAGRVSGNALGIDQLGKGNLINFPAWLKSTRDRFGLAYDPTGAFIACGRKRSAVGILQRWLATQDD